MAKESPIVFSELIENLTKTRSFLGDTASTMSGEMKEQFDALLKVADKHFGEFKTAVPDCVDMLNSKHAELAKKHEQNSADLAKAQEKWAAVKEQLANGEINPPQPPPKKPPAPQLGSFLRNELLDKLAPELEPTKPVSDVAWRDWNLEGGWITNHAKQ